MLRFVFAALLGSAAVISAAPMTIAGAAHESVQVQAARWSNSGTIGPPEWAVVAAERGTHGPLGHGHCSWSEAIKGKSCFMEEHGPVKCEDKWTCPVTGKPDWAVAASERGGHGPYGHGHCSWSDAIKVRACKKDAHGEQACEDKWMCPEDIH